jgi:hypothetical protein
MDATFAANTSPATIDWIRKRDGEVVRLEVEKLAQSLEYAAEQLNAPLLAQETVFELARMAVFFLRSHASTQVASSDDVAEWTEKSLRETGNSALADQYADYRRRKLWAQHSLAVMSDEPADDESSATRKVWDKSRIVQVLRTRLLLDTRRSRMIASQIERYVIRSRFDRLTTRLIRELVNGELAKWNLSPRLTTPGEIQIWTSQLKRALAGPAGLAGASLELTRRVWHEFSLHELVSRDVANAERRGLISVQGLGAPSTLAAVPMDCGSLARQSLGFRHSIVQFGELLARSIGSCSRVLAIDRVESWLALVAEPGDTAGRLAEQFWNELWSRLRYCSLPCVLNLYGGMPPGADAAHGVGPLFSQQPLSAEREFAGAVSREILDLFRRDAGEWRNLRLDWHWVRAPDPVQTALRGHIARVVDEGHHVAIAFDREPAPLGEGLRRLREVARPVLDYVGVSLPVLWHDAGCPRSLVALEEGLRHALGLAVRAAVQKREFIRRLPSGAHQSAVDQALVAIYPIGLDWTVRQLVGRGGGEDEGALKLCETIVQFLRDSAGREARHFALGVVIDHPVDTPRQANGESRLGEPDQRICGLVPTGDNVGMRRRIHAAGRLHTIAQAGTVSYLRNPQVRESHDQLIDLLEWTLRNTDLVRLQFTSNRPSHDQALVEWPE